MADRLFYEYSVRSPRGFGARQATAYHPLLDPRLVRIGVHLPPTLRFLHRFYRHALRQVNPALTGIPTNRGGMTMKPGREIHDLISGLAASHRRSRVQPVKKTEPALYQALRSLPETEHALTELR
jgi:hypothetical protein